MNEAVIEAARGTRTAGATIWNVIWTTALLTLALQATVTAIWLLLLITTYISGSYAMMTSGVMGFVSFLNFFFIPAVAFLFRLIRAKKFHQRMEAQDAATTETAANQAEYAEFLRFQEMMRYQEAVAASTAAQAAVAPEVNPAQPQGMVTAPVTQRPTPQHLTEPWA